MKKTKYCVICGETHIIVYACGNCWTKLSRTNMIKWRDIHHNIPNYIPKEQYGRYMKKQYKKIWK